MLHDRVKSLRTVWRWGWETGKGGDRRNPSVALTGKPGAWTEPMSVPCSLVHIEEFLNQLNSEIRYGFKTWFLYVNQTCAKSVTWWNRVHHFAVNQINIITTEHNMLVVQHRISCSWPHMHYEAKDNLEVLVLLLPPPEYCDRCVPAHPAYAVLGMESGVSYVRPMLILWKYSHFISPVCFHTEFSVTAKQWNSSSTVLYHS